MKWISYLVLAVVCCVAASLSWSQTAPFVKGLLTWEKPAAAIQNNWLWASANGTQDDIPASIEVALTTPLTDLNAGQPGAPLIDIRKTAYPETNQYDASAMLTEKLGGATGTYLLWVRVLDLAGNPSLWVKSQEFRYDVTTPATPANVKVTIEIKITVGG